MTPQEVLAALADPNQQFERLSEPYSYGSSESKTEIWQSVSRSTTFSYAETHDKIEKCSKLRLAKISPAVDAVMQEVIALLDNLFVHADANELNLVRSVVYESIGEYRDAILTKYKGCK